MNPTKSELQYAIKVLEEIAELELRKATAHEVKGMSGIATGYMDMHEVLKYRILQLLDLDKSERPNNPLEKLLSLPEQEVPEPEFTDDFFLGMTSGDDK